MNKFNYLFCLLFGITSAVSAEGVRDSAFNFKLLDGKGKDIKPAAMEDGSTESKKGMAIFRKKPLASPMEIAINIESNDKSLSNNAIYKINGYKFSSLSSTQRSVKPLFELIDRYTALLEKKHPYRFVTKKRSCMHRQDDFFQCLYDEKESWNTLFFVNNGEISLSLLPVLDEEGRKAIGGAVSISYTIGTGRFFDRTA